MESINESGKRYHAYFNDNSCQCEPSLRLKWVILDKKTGERVKVLDMPEAFRRLPGNEWRNAYKDLCRNEVQTMNIIDGLQNP